MQICCLRACLLGELFPPAWAAVSQVVGCRPSLEEEEEEEEGGEGQPWHRLPLHVTGGCSWPIRRGSVILAEGGCAFQPPAAGDREHAFPPGAFPMAQSCSSYGGTPCCCACYLWRLGVLPSTTSDIPQIHEGLSWCCLHRTRPVKSEASRRSRFTRGVASSGRTSPNRRAFAMVSAIGLNRVK